MPAPNVKIEVKPSIPKVVKPLKASRKRTIAAILLKTINAVRESIQGEAPVRTGNLRKSIRSREKNLHHYQVFVDQRMRAARYEPFVRLGTRPHVIRPRKKKALFWPGLPHPVPFANHPGTKPNDFWERGIKKAEPFIKKAEDEIGIKIERQLTEL